jgi:hypothetical protein
LVELELVKNGWKTMLAVVISSMATAYHAAERFERTAGTQDVLVLPAASRPSINSRISFDPKILFIIFDIEPPIVTPGEDCLAELVL